MNGEMNILDVGRMIDIDRFRKINIDARAPEEVYAGVDMAPENNLDFLHQCARWIPAINFADFGTGRIYAQMRAGTWTHRDEDYLARVCADPDVRAGIAGIGRAGDPSRNPAKSAPPPLDRAAAHTLGDWGAGAASGPD